MFLITRFLSRPFIIRVPFFVILSFNKGALKQKGQKGTTQEPSSIMSRSSCLFSSRDPRSTLNFQLYGVY